MCGISGIYSKKIALNDQNFHEVKIMNQKIKHRGPDFDQVKVISNSCILGHVRLSIIDLTDASNQPMQSKCGRYSIVFNGEIYNYKEIKSELRLEVSSSGDTEVLLEAFALIGLSVLPKLNGIFAFALYDNLQNELTLVRDRFGVKPLYFTINNQRLLFSSEIKALTATTDFEKVFNSEVVSDFLTFLCVPDDKTFFNDIFKVRPGEVKTFKENGDITEYVFAAPVMENSSNIKQDSQFVKQQFSETIIRQSISDVPVGLFLSGGVDSNGILQSLIEEKVSPNTYTADFESDHTSYGSEIDLVNSIVKKQNLKLKRVNISRKLFWNVVDKVIYHQDEPLADPVSIPVYLLSEQVSQDGLKVIHVGEGADEIFFGYESWRMLERLQYLQYIQILIKFLRLSNVLRPLLILRHLMPTRYCEAWRRLILGLPLFWGGTDALTYDEKLKIGVPRSLLDKTDILMLKSYNEFKTTFRDTAPNKWMSYFDLKLRLPELMLMRVDKMTMAYGVEARVPFLDNILASVAWNINIKNKRHKNSMKYIFKKSLSGVVDDQILFAPKKGFNAPAEEWCLESKDYILSEIKRFCTATDSLNFNAVKRLCNTQPRHLWRFYILARWHYLNFQTNYG